MPQGVGYDEKPKQGQQEQTGQEESGLFQALRQRIMQYLQQSTAPGQAMGKLQGARRSRQEQLERDTK